MKKNYSILTLLAVLLCSVTFASTSKDSLAVGKRTRTFATPPATSTVTATPNLVSTVPLRTRTFESLDAVIEKNVKELKRETVSEFTPRYFEELLATPVDSTEAVGAIIGQALAVFEKLDDGGNIVEALDFQQILDDHNPLEPIEFPIGLKQTIGGTHYMVGISDAAFHAEYTEITVFVRIITPESDETGAQRQLFFGATGIRLSREGGLEGDANIVLLGDYTRTISGGNGAIIFKGGFDMETGDIENKTYVTIDCDGFKELKITAEVQFSRDMIVPLTPTNQIDNSFYPNTTTPILKRVGASIVVTVADWSDILVEVDLPRFVIANAATQTASTSAMEQATSGTPPATNTQTETGNPVDNSFVFEINNAVFDFSETRNSTNIIFPPEYQEQYLDQEYPELWKGVYISSVTIGLPKQFQIRNNPNAERIVISGTNLIIDGAGVTGDFAADNVLPLNEGSASKWQFSVDHIEASFLASTWTRASFEGGIVLPLTEEATAADATAQQAIVNGPQENQENNTANNANQTQNTESTSPISLQYIGLINPVTEEYVLTATATRDIPIPISSLGAKATFFENSYIRLEVSDGKFKPEALLHGTMDINIREMDPSNSPDPGNSPSNPNANPDKKQLIQFDQISFQGLFLSTESPYFAVEAFGYDGNLGVNGFPVSIEDIQLTSTDNSAQLEFDLIVNLQENGFGASTRLAINGSFGENEGITKWKYENVTFSEIFIDADIGGAKFDGSITLMDNDPVYGDGFKGNLTAKFKGLGSDEVTVTANAIFGKTDFRYWYVDALADNLNIETGTGFTIKGFGGGAFYRMKKAGFNSSFTASGSEYVPDLDSGLGIKAMVLFSTSGTSKAMNGGAGFEIAFNSSGGLNRISLYGEAHIMQDFDIPNPAAKLKGTLAEVAQNEAGFSDAVLDQLKETNLVEVSKEVYPDNVAGEVGLNAYAAIEYDFTTSTLHGSFDLYIDAAGGLFTGLASGNRAGWAVVHFAPDSWYVHMGTPTDRLGIKVGIGGASIESGGYFMIGDNIPDFPAPPAIVADILGVDLAELDSMRDENALGDGRGFAFGTNFSIDTGDISFLIFYARLQAGVGFDIMVKDYGNAECNGSGQIGLNGWYASGQAYAYLQGELGVNVKLLFIKKKVPIISAGLAVLMQAKLPNPVWFRGYAGGHFSVLGGLVKGRFRMKVEFGEQCEFVDGAPLGGLKIIADINPTDGSDEVDVFTAPQVGFNMRVDYPFELEDDDGVKTYRIKLKEFKVTENGTQIVGESTWNDNNDLLTFTSEDVLPPTTDLQLKVSVNFEERVNGVWQVLMDDGQEAIETEIRNFTTGEAPDYIPHENIAYMYPTMGQKYVHKDEHGEAFVQLITGQDYLFENIAGFSQKAYFISEQGSSETSISYNNGSNKVYLNIPGMSNNVDYTLTMVTEPTTSGQQGNLNQTYTEQDLGQDTEVEVLEVSLGESVVNAEAVEMLSFDFHTSEYNTFADKIASKAYIQPMVEIIYSDVHALHTRSNETEPFDIEEIEGSTLTDYKPMMQIEADLSNNAYYQNEIYPLIYENYPINNFTVDRDVSLLGLPPVKSMDLLEWYPIYVETDPNSYLIKERIPFRYLLPLTFKQDFIDIQYKVTNAYLNDPSAYADQIAQYEYIINGIFPYIKQGNYNTKVKYVLPDGTVTSTTDYLYNKPN